MTPYETTRYRCDHCRKSYSKKGTCLAHEKECHHDPAVRACTTCKHFVPRDTPEHWVNGCTANAFEIQDYTTGEIVEDFRRHCPMWEAK